MAKVRRSPAGRPMKHDLRAMLDAIDYVTRYGIEWRHCRWTSLVRDGVCLLRPVERTRLAAEAVDRLRGRLRTAWGRSELPTAGSHRHHHQTQRHHRIGRAAPPVGGGTDLRLVTALSPPGPRLRTTTRIPRSHGAVGHPRDHDPQTSPGTIELLGVDRDEGVGGAGWPLSRMVPVSRGRPTTLFQVAKPKVISW